LVEERFPDPVLVEAVEDGRTVALALFNRTRQWFGPPVLHLGESGTVELDCPYVEQNGVLTEAGREDELTTLCLRAVASRYDLVLSGISESVLASVRRAARLVLAGRSQASPFVDLAALRATRTDYLSSRSANTRQQIRRSDRYYQQSGPIVLEPAGSVEAAYAVLEEMATLHQAAWTARGQPGSFAQPFFRRFHRALIATAMPRGEVTLLKISSNETTIGILYNFVHNGRSLAYQSGLVYQGQASHAKPGLTCHARAVQLASDQGLDVYDFLAGDDRYKRSLADGSHQQIWARAGPFWSPLLLFRRAILAFR
jgi:CelD/BcsL family acetyltransferase involved in cellulose biosynthesis